MLMPQSIPALAVSQRTGTPPVGAQPESMSEQRPWGCFEQFTTNARTTVKVITVAPGARLSLQRHEHRDEQWVILDDGVEVEVGGELSRPAVASHVWVPRGTLHRMANVGSAPARVLEISYGDFDEKDIERLADDYNR